MDDSSEGDGESKLDGQADNEIEVDNKKNGRDVQVGNNSSNHEIKEEDREVEENIKQEEESDNKKTTKGEKSEKRPVKNWPLCDIKEPHDNDVLYGRGGGTNHHVGNKRYRLMVEERKVHYVNSKRLDKPLVALDIIRNWRAQDPPGRFLKLIDSTGLWHDVGDKKAREKTSQALREKAPLLRQQQKEEEVVIIEDEDQGASPIKLKTRFNVPGKSPKKDKKNIIRPILGRDHSLGHDYLDPNETVTADIWNKPFEESNAVLPSSSESPSSRYQQGRQDGWGDTAFVVRGSGSPVVSNNSMSPPPPRDNYNPTREHSFVKNPLREASVSGPAHNPWKDEGWETNRYTRDSIDNNEMPPQSFDAHQHREYDSDRPLYSHSRSGKRNDRHRRTTPDGAAVYSEGEDDTSRRINNERKKPPVGSNDYEKLADMMGGGNYPIKPSYSSHSAHSNDNGYGADEYNSNTMYSSDNKPYYYYDEYQKRSPPIYNSPSKHRQPSPERSRCEARPNYNSQQYNEQDDYPDSYKRNGRHDDRIMKKRRDPLPSPEEGYRPGHRPQKHNLVSNLPRPSIVKRETSHQNENLETKRNVKRSMFRQDYGISINEPRTTVSGNSDEDDKKPYTVADVFDDNFGRNNVEDDMKVLETTMGQSTLNTPRIAKRNSKNSGSKLKNNCYGEKPKGLTSSERMSTVDAVRLEFTTGISVDEVEKLSSIVNVDRGCSVDRIVEEMEVSSKFIEIRTEGSSKFKLMDGFDFDEEHIPQKPVPISKDRFSSDDAVEFTIREVDSLKETSKFSIGSRESTFGSIELDIDSENPDKIWGEE